MNEQQIEATAEALRDEGVWCGDCDEPDYDGCEQCRETCHRFARIAIKAAHPTLTNANELEVLPTGAIVRCNTAGKGIYFAPGDVWGKDGDNDWGLMRDLPISSRTKDIPRPATVLDWGTK